MLSRRGQSVLEYTIIVGIVTVLLYYMGTGIKRGVQSLVKITADQVGNQQQADQDFSDTRQGYLQSSDSVTQQAKNKQVTELGYIPAPLDNVPSGNPVYLTNTGFNESTDTVTNTITNGGFTPSN